MTSALLEVKELTKTFGRAPGLRPSGFGGASRPAVDDVSFAVTKGECFGIVGESGCGKTTLARLLLALAEPTSGRVVFDGSELATLGRTEMKALRRRMQVVFQDPYSAFDPRCSVYDILAEPLRVHRLGNADDWRRRAEEALESVGLPPSSEFLFRMPAELSGGQRQRLGIARALMLEPELIVADEPVSMLDASVKAGVLSLLMELQRERGLTYVFITHEMPVAYHVCDRIAVMYAGSIVELGPAEDVVRAPEHPYTKLLMASVPPLEPDEHWSPANEFDVDVSLSPAPNGDACSFYTRCPDRGSECQSGAPGLRRARDRHFVACHQPTFEDNHEEGRA
jgi:oligopeptide transport system ATP-binding protein